MIFAVVPTIGEASGLPSLVDQLADECDSVILTVNDLRVYPNMRHYNRRGVDVAFVDGSIYAGWNLGIEIADFAGAEYLAVLNDDATPEIGAISATVDMMRLNHDVWMASLDYQGGERPRALRRCSGTYRHGGLCGWAFVLDVRKTPWADNTYEWWYGDDDLTLRVETAGGKCAIAEGCYVTHVGEETSRNHPWTEEAKVRDLERFRAQWGDR